MAALADYESFVREWMQVHAEGGTRRDVEKRFGISKAASSSRVAKLKKNGIDLPELARSNEFKSMLPNIKKIMQPEQATRPGLKKPPVV